MKLIGAKIKDESKLLTLIEDFRQTVLTQLRDTDIKEQELGRKIEDTDDAEDVFKYAHQFYEKRLKEMEFWAR